LALCEAAVRRGARHGISELKIVETFAALAFGKIVPTPNNLAAALTGGRFCVWMPPFKLDERNAGLSYRHGNAFRPWVDDLRRKLRRLRRSNADDARWLVAMGRAWDICLDGAIERLDEAQRLAEAVGEREHFQMRMRPELIARSGLGPVANLA
jgi:hypothetical protein